MAGAAAAAAADEMDDLNAVAFGKEGARPVGAPHHFAIEFNGEPFGGERKLFDELIEGRALWHFDRFAVDLDLQAVCSPLRGLFDYAW